MTQLARRYPAVFLGADGSGKSSVIDRIAQGLSPRFWGDSKISLRPTLFRTESPLGPPAVEPHGEKPCGAIGSLAKLLYYLMYYNIGDARQALRHAKLGTS